MNLDELDGWEIVRTAKRIAAAVNGTIVTCHLATGMALHNETVNILCTINYDHVTIELQHYPFSDDGRWQIDVHGHRHLAPLLSVRSRTSDDILNETIVHLVMRS